MAASGASDPLVQARNITFDFIECFSNQTRKHPTLHYLSPLAYEQLMCYIPSLGSPQKRVRIIVKTVQKHVQSILNRIGVKSRIEAAYLIYYELSSNAMD
jgi:hypothetical protein